MNSLRVRQLSRLSTQLSQRAVLKCKFLAMNFTLNKSSLACTRLSSFSFNLTSSLTFINKGEQASRGKRRQSKWCGIKMKAIKTKWNSWEMRSTPHPKRLQTSRLSLNLKWNEEETLVRNYKISFHPLTSSQTWFSILNILFSHARDNWNQSTRIFQNLYLCKFIIPSHLSRIMSFA